MTIDYHAFPLSGSRPAMEVSERFQSFLNNIKLSDVQRTDGATKRSSVCTVLNQKYYATNSGTENSLFVGSWGKETRTRPPRDVDVLFRLPDATYHRFQTYVGSKQSALLQEVKNALGPSFPRTDIRGDGPVVKVPFQSYAVELVPAFKLMNGRHWIAITSNGGRYKEFDPDAEAKHIHASNIKTKGNTRALVRMLKAWQANCSVPLKSFYLELLSVDFLNQWKYAANSTVYYDWMCRDFFYYLLTQKYGTLWVPGTYEMLSLGTAWESRAQTAYDRAVKACQYESDKMPYSAGEEWQKIFGMDIPAG